MEPHSVVEAQVDIPADQIPPGEVVVTVEMKVDGLKTSKQTSFVFGEDLPDVTPVGMIWTQEVSANIISGVIRNQGQTLAQNVTASFYLGKDETGTLLSTIAVGDINPGEAVEINFDPSVDLLDQQVTMVVALLDGQEFCTSNNVLSKLFESLNHIPEVTWLGPDSDIVLGNPHSFSWTATDEDGDPLTAALYLDDDTNPDNGRTALDFNLSTNMASMGTTHIPEGNYFVSVTVSDDKGGNFTLYSAGRVMNGDMDNDKVLDHSDNCPGIPNPDQLDEDDDTIGDICDEFPDDHDNDGLTEQQEIDFGTDRAKWDTDGDGFGDGDEVAWGSNPISRDGVPHCSGLLSLPAGHTASAEGVRVQLFSATVNSSSYASSIWVNILENEDSAQYSLTMPSDFSQQWYVGYNYFDEKKYKQHGFFTELKTVENLSDVQFFDGGSIQNKVDVTLLKEGASWNIFMPAILNANQD
jgi:hypothetical protein